MTRERIIVASDDAVKVRTYNRLVDAHRGEAIRISRRPARAARQLTLSFLGLRTLRRDAPRRLHEDTKKQEDHEIREFFETSS